MACLESGCRKTTKKYENGLYNKVLAHAQWERQPNLKRRKEQKNESQTLVLRPDYVGAFPKTIFSL